ncbi:High affinity iron permease [Blumeria graminis f. sp. tritici 96224]|uniref:High affinity iron permease n=1 Tax=Blumeria graminis f. sp. tritici 96224 TaxID=1268274 RepID=A0A656KIV2_BLUGR|nr:High affinity iron permease [Blumeria graminis f. sp. tritici 96224]
MSNLFAVPVFFIVFRETLETAVIVSVLLAFLKKTINNPDSDKAVYKRLVRQIWLGTATGLLICIIIGSGLIGAFYTLGNNSWEKYEYIYEGSFAIISSLIISILGAALLRVSKMQGKWRIKLAKVLEDRALTVEGKRASIKLWFGQYVLFMVPFVTIMREGLEAVIFVAGVSFSAPATAVPLAVAAGLIAGGAVGWLIYNGGKSSQLQIFLVISTGLLYLVAAGLFSRAVWFFEQYKWNQAVGGEAAEMGAGPGSYDIDQRTYGSVISYNIYWITVIIGFLVMRFKEINGHLPFRKTQQPDHSQTESDSDRGDMKKYTQTSLFLTEVSRIEEQRCRSTY